MSYLETYMLFVSCVLFSVFFSMLKLICFNSVFLIVVDSICHTNGNRSCRLWKTVRHLMVIVPLGRCICCEDYSEPARRHLLLLLRTPTASGHLLYIRLVSRSRWPFSPIPAGCWFKHFEFVCGRTVLSAIYSSVFTSPIRARKTCVLPSMNGFAMCTIKETSPTPIFFLQVGARL